MTLQNRLLGSKARILALSPHTDDYEWGAGATLASLKDKGHEISVQFFSWCEESVPDGFEPDILKKESAAAMSALFHEPAYVIDGDLFPVRRFSEHRQDILEMLIHIRNDFRPNLVFCPSSSDTHQDHQVIRQEAFRAFKLTSLLGYHNPWNDDPTQPFSPTMYCDFAFEYLERKKQALDAYESQADRHYMKFDFVTSMARLRGTEVGVMYAEAFEVIRERWTL